MNKRIILTAATMIACQGMSYGMDEQRQVLIPKDLRDIPFQERLAKANSGDIVAQFEVGYDYLNENGDPNDQPEKDVKEAIRRFKSVANQNAHPEYKVWASIELAELYKTEKEYSKALGYCNTVIDTESPRYLGSHTYDPYGRVSSSRTYSAAIASAFYIRGMMFAKGKNGIQKNLEQAEKDLKEFDDESLLELIDDPTKRLKVQTTLQKIKGQFFDASCLHCKYPFQEKLALANKGDAWALVCVADKYLVGRKRFNDANNKYSIIGPPHIHDNLPAQDTKMAKRYLKLAAKQDQKDEITSGTFSLDYPISANSRLAGIYKKEKKWQKALDRCNKVINNPRENKKMKEATEQFMNNHPDSGQPADTEEEVLFPANKWWSYPLASALYIRGMMYAKGKYGILMDREQAKDDLQLALTNPYLKDALDNSLGKLDGKLLGELNGEWVGELDEQVVDGRRVVDKLDGEWVGKLNGQVVVTLNGELIGEVNENLDGKSIGELDRRLNGKLPIQMVEKLVKKMDGKQKVRQSDKARLTLNNLLDSK